MSNIIFDFDGTLADSLPMAMDLFYKWSKRVPYSPIEVEKMRNMTLKQVLNQVGIPLWRVPSLLVNGRAELGRHIHGIPLFMNIDNILKELQQRGHTMVVMSSNSPQNIHKFLKHHTIDQYFDGVHGNTGLFSKTNALKAILRKYKWQAIDTLAIGDEARDIDAAKKAGITSIAVGWGYNGEQILRAHKPDFFVSKPSELLKLLQ